jgi:ectoine hydroxylase-related dioxygenase (phytanoyl-CoA dioxygenase family)
MLTLEQLEQFDNDGFLVIPNFFEPKPMRERAGYLLNQMDLKDHPLTKFTTTDDNHIGDKYFLESGDKIRFFLEEKSVNSKNQLIVDKEQAINKIGHALHELDPVFEQFSKSEKVVDLARSLNFKDCRILQSMLIFKQPSIGGEVPPHVDSTFLYTEPTTSAIGLWFALEDCTLDNGCLWIAPGSHKKFKLGKRFISSNGKTKMIQLEGANGEPTKEEYVAAPVSAGSLVLIHGLVHHKSGPNLSKKSRWIYTFHMIDGALNYPEDNWLQPTKEMPFTKL